jgi:predicted ArsR family transcriptional regulator
VAKSADLRRVAPGGASMTSEVESLQKMLAEQGQQMYRDFMVRTIEMLERMKSRFGPDVTDVVDEMVADRTLKQWSGIAQGEQTHTAADLVRLLWEPLATRGFEFTVEETDEGLQILCTKCALSDLAQEIDGAEWMFHLNCGTDPHIVEGFNPKIGFRRSKTLMQGHDCCDHFYEYPSD